MVEHSKNPVFAKIRSGYSDKNINYIKIGKIAQDVGCAAVTLHPRTAETKRSGVAKWDHIKKLKNKLDIPVIGNGDIQTPEDAIRMRSETGCDYVMLGRAAARNPYIFKQCIDLIVEKRSPSQDMTQSEWSTALYTAVTLSYGIGAGLSSDQIKSRESKSKIGDV